MDSHFSSRLFPFSPITVDVSNLLTMQPGYYYGVHLHHTVELFLCLTGEIVITVFEQQVTVHPGEYFVCFPDFPHDARVTGHVPCTIVQLHFYASPFRRDMPRQPAAGEFAFAFEITLGRRNYLTGPCSSQLEACIRGIHAETSREQPDSHVLVPLYEAQLNVLLSREVTARKPSGSVYENPHLLTASQFIDDHYMEKLSVQDVADACGISVRYVTKLFHENFDIGVYAYIMHVRISKAIDLAFLNPGYPLSKLALDVGFSSQQHFSNVFREKMSVSPGRYFSLHPVRE